MARNLSLTERIENVRDVRRVLTPVHFSTEQIMNHFTESMSGVKAQYAVAADLLEGGNENGCKTIWRSQIVLAEGLLDFYLHEMSKYCLFQMFCGNWEKTQKYMSIMIPMEKVEEAISAAESNEWFFEYLNIRFSRDVFLSAESMREQLNLIGIGFVAAMVKAFPRDKQETSNRDGSRIINNLFRRRNEIAHQNDRSHESAEQTDICQEFVEEYITNIENIVKAIHYIAQEKDEI